MGHTLRGFSLLHGLSEPDLTLLAAGCTWKLYRRGAEVSAPDGPRDVLFIVRGAVEIVEALPSGGFAVRATVAAGHLVGELAVLDGDSPRPIALAAGNCLIAAMPGEVFLDLLRHHAEIAVRLLRRLARMVNAGDAQVVEQAGLAVSRRVYAELLRRARPDPAGAAWLVRPLSLKDLAESVGATRELVRGAVARLYRSGAASRDGNSLWLLDRGWMDREIGRGS